MRSLVTGGTGFVGHHLIERLDRPAVLGRSIRKINRLAADVIPCQWQPGTSLDPHKLNGIDTVFHLAGESVFKGRWNENKKERIMASRVEGTRSLVQALGELERPPATFVCASAIGYYGARGEEALTESTAPGNDFLARVCLAWEEEAKKAEDLGIRVVCVRLGIVLGSDGGALAQMLLPFRLGLGGRIGSGRQFMSWIHIEDLINIFLYVAEHPEIRGPVNAVAPQPVTNRDFTSELAAVLHRPAFFHVPGAVLRLTIGEFAEVLLGSQKVLPDILLKSGFRFSYPTLESALQNLLN